MKKFLLLFLFVVSGIVTAKSQSISYTLAYSDPEDQLFVNNDTLTVDDQYASVKVWLDGSMLNWAYTSTPPAGVSAAGSSRNFSIWIYDPNGPGTELPLVNDQNSSATSNKSLSGSYDLGSSDLSLDIIVNQTFAIPSQNSYSSGYWAVADYTP